MAMAGHLLAEEIRAEMGFPPPTSVPIIGWATGFVLHMQTSGLATKGGIPGPHIISGINGPGMAALITATALYPFPSPELISFCQAVATYIMTNAQVFYIGPPPPAAPDWFLGGTISGLDGAAMAAQVAVAIGKPGPTPDLIAKCSAIVNHLQTNGQVIDGVIS